MWRVGEYTGLQLKRVKVEDRDLEHTQGRAEVMAGKLAPGHVLRVLRGLTAAPGGEYCGFTMKLTKPKLLGPSPA